MCFCSRLAKGFVAPTHLKHLLRGVLSCCPTYHTNCPHSGDSTLTRASDAGCPTTEYSTDPVGMAPLHWAATEGRLRASAWLLGPGGADPEGRDNQVRVGVFVHGGAWWTRGVCWGRFRRPQKFSRKL